MKFIALRSLKVFALMTFVWPAMAQTVHVDVTPSRALDFDPDKAMGTSIDILPAKDFEKDYTEAVIKEGLSAGWGPITYRQNTELTYDAWHWNPNGTWSDEKNKSGYFLAVWNQRSFCASLLGSVWRIEEPRAAIPDSSNLHG